jgi:[glutamine synthetase] adenylyltransferase / [glutamine synthetase]-adenylyl-L-tyrosine phosphorylase
MGFADVPRAERELDALGIATDSHPLLAGLAQAADPDLALTGLAQVADRDKTLLKRLIDDTAFRARLIAVLGVSKALADHLARHPADSSVLQGRDADRRPEPGLIRDELLRAVGADPGDRAPVAATAGPDAKADPAALLAAAYRRRLLHLAARDRTGVAAFDEVAAELADLADAVLDAALAVARAELPADAAGGAAVRLAVVAMGKCGARELNYASDVDVIFVAEPADEQTSEQEALNLATKLAAGMIRVCERSTPEGAIFPVDPNLRPEGRQGPLVRTLASHLAYYDRWAKTWEFQALLKARPAAGDRELGDRYAVAVAPLVWQAAQRDNFVEDVQAMRRRVVATLPKNMAGRELKLGPGGLRDIEFAVQLLQLVHGSADDRLRVPGTLPALKALADGGYVGRADAEELAQAYRFLRQTEHLLQLYQLRRTHTLPTDPAVLRRLGRAMRNSQSLTPVILNDRVVSPVQPPSLASAQHDIRVAPSGRPPSPEEAFTQAWTRHAQQVRRLHEKLFYRPLLDAVAKLPSGAARLTPDAARARLEALGYRDPAGALRHIQALTSGLRRRAAIQRTLLPVLLGWFADAAEPDAGLLAFRQVSEALGETPWFLRLLRDETKAAERMAYVLASSRYATGLLLRAPEAVAIFADDAELVPKTSDALRAEMMAATKRHVAGLGPPETSLDAKAGSPAAAPTGLTGLTAAGVGAGAGAGAGQRSRSAADAEQAAVIIRSLRRRELLRVAASNVLGLIGLAETAEALTAITTATLDAVLTVAVAKIEMELRAPLSTRFAVIAMGRYGGHESGFGSDADVIFVHDPQPTALDGAADRRASEAAQAVGTELRRLLSLPAPDPPLLVDADLRPEGKQGPLVRSLAACRAYYERRAAPWERQALLRAEFAVGDAALGAEFIALADQFRYPVGGLDEPTVREIRRIKARMESERIPRGTDRALHLKLGPGGLSDVEWTVQLLQLRHGHAGEGLRTTRTIEALDAAVAAGLATHADAEALAAAWRFGSRIRNAIMLVRGRPGDALPAKHDELTAVARLLGYKPSVTPADIRAQPIPTWNDTPAQALEEDYRRNARRARKVMDRLFYG